MTDAEKALVEAALVVQPRGIQAWAGNIPHWRQQYRELAIPMWRLQRKMERLNALLASAGITNQHTGLPFEETWAEYERQDGLK